MKPLHFIQLLVLALIWGGAFLFTRVSVHEFGPIPMSAVRTAVASLMLMPILIYKGYWGLFKKNWPHIMVIGLISTALPFSLISVTTQYTSAGFAAILNSLTPIFSAMVAWLWLKEHLSLPAIFGIGLSFIGVLAMILDTQSISSEFPLLPILCGLGATFLYGLAGNYSRKFLTGIPALALAGGCHFFATLFLLPFAIILWPETTISHLAWMNVILLGIICTGIAFILYFYLLEHIGVAKTVIVTYMVPVVAMFFGVIFLNETVTLQMLIGAALIMTGIGLTTGLIKRRQRKHK